MIGLIIFLVHRLLVIFFIIKWSTVADFIPIFIGITSFIFILYANPYQMKFQKVVVILLLLKNVLVSVPGWIVLSKNCMNENARRPWLMIFG
jgi:ABC-type transport system involved in Fe-S cluster assembly fused permease/ATPase subunit